MRGSPPTETKTQLENTKTKKDNIRRLFGEGPIEKTKKAKKHNFPNVLWMGGTKTKKLEKTNKKHNDQNLKSKT